MYSTFIQLDNPLYCRVLEPIIFYCFYVFIPLALKANTLADELLTIFHFLTYFTDHEIKVIAYAMCFNTRGGSMQSPFV